MFHWPAVTSGPRLHFRPLPHRAALKTGAPFEWQRLGKKTNFCLIPRSRSVDEKQPRISILTEWIGMGRSGPQITAKRQLWDCVTLTMVLLSLLFRPGKCVLPVFLSFLFFLPPQSVLLHSSLAACEVVHSPKWRWRWKKVNFTLLCVAKRMLFVNGNFSCAWYVTFYGCFGALKGEREREKSLLCESSPSTAGTKYCLVGGSSFQPARLQHLYCW